MPGHHAAHAIGSLLLLFLSACEREVAISQPADLPVEFATGQLLIARAAGDTVRLGVYIAETQEQTSFGLMQRPELHADSGMVFLFPRERAPTDSFYMYRTLIPLSIAFVRGDGTIGSIREMEPCTSNNSSSCPYYAAGVPYRSAVEANSGYFTRHGIKVGDRVILQR